MREREVFLREIEYFSPTTRRFLVDKLPVKVQEIFKKGGSWLNALDEAISSGKKDLDLLADIIFFRQHPERIKDRVGELIDPHEKEFVKLRVEWNHNRTIANLRLNSSLTPGVFLTELISNRYEDFIAKQTTGKITLMINGRSRRGSGLLYDRLDAFNSMQQTVESLGPNDYIYLAAWQFIPIECRLTLPRQGLLHWGDLLKKKAQEGIKIRIIISIHPDQGDIFNSDLPALDKLINEVSNDKRDNFKYIASRHPGKDFVSVTLPVPGMKVKLIEIRPGDHHQKFLVTKKGNITVAYCGGLDISRGRTSTSWNSNWVWHDIHAKLEGLIAKDIEREFVSRWNHEKENAKTSEQPRPQWKFNMLPGWKDFEKLYPTPVNSLDKNSHINVHKLQMLRTVSLGVTKLQDNKRDDIWQGYFKLIARAKSYLYLENQYFQEPNIADAIVKQMQTQGNLVVIIVVTTGTDDPDSPYLHHCLKLRHEFFTNLFKETSVKDRIRVYTMFPKKGLVHSKLIMVDDQVLSMGSANANQRGFYIDTELNVMLENVETVRNFRYQLWSHNLWVPPAVILSWRVPDFIAHWDSIANSNKFWENKNQPDKMVGEGIISFDPLNFNSRSRTDIMRRYKEIKDIWC